MQSEKWTRNRQTLFKSKWELLNNAERGGWNLVYDFTTQNYN